MFVLGHCLLEASITLNHDQIASGLLARDHACKYHTLILYLGFNDATEAFTWEAIPNIDFDWMLDSSHDLFFQGKF